MCFQRRRWWRAWSERLFFKPPRPLECLGFQQQTESSKYNLRKGESQARRRVQRGSRLANTTFAGDRVRIDSKKDFGCRESRPSPKGEVGALCKIQKASRKKDQRSTCRRRQCMSQSSEKFVHGMKKKTLKKREGNQ